MVLVAALSVLVVPAAAAPNVVVVADGPFNPRGIAVGCLGVPHG